MNISAFVPSPFILLYLLARDKAQARADSLQKQVWACEEDVQNLRKVLIFSFMAVLCN